MGKIGLFSCSMLNRKHKNKILPGIAANNNIFQYEWTFDT